MGTFLLLSFLAASTTFAQHSYRLSKAPFYKSFKKEKVDAKSLILHLPVALDTESGSEFFYRGREEVLQPLINTINQYLDSLQWSPGVGNDTFTASAKGAPSLIVGSSESEIAPPSAEMLREDYDRQPPMVMHVNKPSREWRGKLSALMEQHNSEYAMVFWLAFNQYPKSKKGLFKKKVILGTGYEPEIRFLSDELEPVEVLQLSGMLLNRKGEIVRAGAEAFLYEDSPFWVQVLEAETLISDKKIRQSIEQIRREDLPGKPVAWKVALFHLIEQLCQRPHQFTAAELNK